MKKIILMVAANLMAVFFFTSIFCQEIDTMTIGEAKRFRSIPYAQAHERQNLDLYLPKNTNAKTPLLVWMHGGAWRTGYKKWVDVPYLIMQGYAIASIDFRYSSDSVFPAQIRDCNAAIFYLWQNAEQYNLDTAKFVVGGGSSGGHLASLIGTSSNNDVKEFYPYDAEKYHVSIKAVLDFYGPSDLYAFHGGCCKVDVDDEESPITALLGAPALMRPDLAKIASPTTYVDQNDPPFLILHGDKDNLVPIWQSQLFYSVLSLAGVRAEMVTLKGSGHASPMFLSPEMQQKVVVFLNSIISK